MKIKKHLFLYIICVGLMFRLINLTKYDLSYDEIIALIRAVSCGSRVLPHIAYNLFLQCWQVFGTSALVLRLSSVCFGVASIFAIYLLAKKLFDVRVAYVSAFLLSISPLHIYHSQELRTYSLTVFFVILATYFFIKALEEHSYRYWVGNVICNCVCIYIYYPNILIIGAQLGYLLFFIKKSKNHLYRLCLFQLIQLVLIVVWFYICLWPEVKDISYNAWQRPYIKVASFLDIFYTLKNFAAGYYAPNVIRMVGGLISIAMLLKAFIQLLRENKEKMVLLLWFFAFPIIFLLAFSFCVKPLYADRYVTCCLPFFYILIGFCVSRMKKVKAILVMIVVCMISVFSLHNYYLNCMESPYWERLGVVKRKEFKMPAEFIRQNYKKNDLIVHTSEVSLLPIEYYLDRSRKKVMLNSKACQTNEFLYKVRVMKSDLGEKPRLIIHDPEKHNFRLGETIDELMACDNSQLLEDYKRVWLISSAWGDYYFEEFNQWFNQRYILLEAREYDGVKVFLYQVNWQDATKNKSL